VALVAAARGPGGVDVEAAARTIGMARLGLVVAWCADLSSLAPGGSLLRGATLGSAAGGRPCCWRAAALLVAARPRSEPNRA
jgi:hypothetical protein